MASTYIVSAQQIPFSANRQVLSLFNPAASGKVVKVYRVWLENNQGTAVTGVATLINLTRITTASGGVARTPQAFDTTATALGTVSAGTNMTVTETDLLRKVIWSSDEPSLVGATVDELQTFQTFNSIWDSAFIDSNVEPIVCREGYGITIKNLTSTVGFVDCFIQFTVE